jgi:hypothetical protein
LSAPNWLEHVRSSERTAGLAVAARGGSSCCNPPQWADEHTQSQARPRLRCEDGRIVPRCWTVVAGPSPVMAPPGARPSSDEHENALFRLRPARGGTFNRPMPRKPAVPTIPAKPTGRPKPERSRAHPKRLVAWTGRLAGWLAGAGSARRVAAFLIRGPTVPFKANQNRRHHIPRQRHRVHELAGV